MSIPIICKITSHLAIILLNEHLQTLFYAFFSKLQFSKKKSNSFMCWTTNTSVSSMSQQAWVQFVIHI